MDKPPLLNRNRSRRSGRVLWTWICRGFWMTRWLLILEILMMREAHGITVDPCPTNCSCLGVFVDCTYRRLTEIPSDLPVWTEVLYLQHNFITNITNESLRNLMSLKELDLGNNFIANMSQLVLQLPPNIRKLELNDNRILEAAMPANLSKLHQLNLRSNNIFQLRSLHSADNLDLLDLSDNQLKNLGSNLDNSSVLPLSLTKLKLNQNRIAAIPKEAFKSLSALQSLDLGGNDIAEIEGLAFNGLRSLNSLNLEENGIKSLNDGTFFGLVALKILQLQSNNVTAVRKGWMYGLGALQHLNLTKNRVERIEDGAWEFSREIIHLDLSFNALTVINKLTFTQAGNLVFLNLSGNSIGHIADDSFKQLKRLVNLDLSDNQVGHILESPTSVFGWLKSLQVLRLRRTGAVNLSGQGFGGLRQLQELDLMENEISSAEPDAFRGLMGLKRLFLKTSSFICDSDVSGFLHLMQTKAYPDAQFICAFPLELKGKELKSLTPSQLKYLDKPRPKIETDPKNVVAVAGSNITVSCSVSFPSDSPASIRWKKDDAPVVNGIVSNAPKSSGGVTVYVSRLTFANIERLNSGNYQCMASNNFGSVYSSKAKVAVHVFPVFVKYPQHVSTRVGATVKLECSATGNPRPQIRWKKDGGINFPAAQQRRLRYEGQGSDVMHIVNVSREDVGIYACIASNAAGSTVANASLVISDTYGHFISDTTVQTREVGGSSWFECQKSPNGKRYHWLKNGKPLVPTSKHSFPSDGNVLVVSDLTEADSGIYQCETEALEEYDLGQVYTLKVKRKRGSWWDLDDKTTQIWIIGISVGATFVITSLVWGAVIIFRARSRRRGVSSTGTEETILPDECNPINAGLHPADSLDSPMTDYSEYIPSIDSVDEEFLPTEQRGRNRVYSHQRYDESSSESHPSFATYSTLKPARANKGYTASPHRSCNTIPRVTR